MLYVREGKLKYGRREIARKAAEIKKAQEEKESETYEVVLTDSTK